MTEPAGVFISYRHADTDYPAGWLDDFLTSRLGRDRVFKDGISIQPGEDYVTAINDALGTCHTLLAVIGPGWLTGPGGERLLEVPGDFVCREIKAALDRRIRVIPVLVNGARMPTYADLPASIRALARLHAIVLTAARFSDDAARLLAVLEALPPAAARQHPAPASRAESPGRSRPAEAEAPGRLPRPGKGDQDARRRAAAADRHSRHPAAQHLRPAVAPVAARHHVLRRRVHHQQPGRVRGRDPRLPRRAGAGRSLRRGFHGRLDRVERGRHRIPATPVTPAYVAACLTPIARSLDVERIATEPRVRDGYAGMIVATGFASGP